MLQLIMATSFSPSLVLLENLVNARSIFKFGAHQNQEQSSKTCHIQPLFNVEHQLSMHTLLV